MQLSDVIEGRRSMRGAKAKHATWKSLDLLDLDSLELEGERIVRCLPFAVLSIASKQ